MTNYNKRLDELEEQFLADYRNWNDGLWDYNGLDPKQKFHQALIRTEKLKLLAEVREQTTIFKIKAHDKKGQPHLYEAGRGVPTEVLDKLEAEL